MHVPLGGDPMEDQRPDGRIISPNWLRNTSEVARNKKSGSLSWKCYPCDPIPDTRLKMMDGYLDTLTPYKKFGPALLPEPEDSGGPCRQLGDQVTTISDLICL